MFDLPLTREPDLVDGFGPVYLVDQVKGLREHQDYELIERALEEGFTSLVGRSLRAWVAETASRLRETRRTIRVIEFGGGRGELFDALQPLVASFVNVDPGQPESGSESERRSSNPRYQLLRCSAEDVPLPDNSGDLVVAIASLDHVPDYRKALLEASRLLASGGLFLATVNNRRSWWKVLLSRTAWLRRREAFIADQHYFQWDHRQAEAELRRSFDVVDVSSTTFLPYIPKTSKALLPVADALGGRVLNKRGGNLLIRAEKRALMEA